jgi:hypothetical protein
LKFAFEFAFDFESAFEFSCHSEAAASPRIRGMFSHRTLQAMNLLLNLLLNLPLNLLLNLGAPSFAPLFPAKGGVFDFLLLNLLESSDLHELF